MPYVNVETYGMPTAPMKVALAHIANVSLVGNITEVGVRVDKLAKALGETTG